MFTKPTAIALLGATFLLAACGTGGAGSAPAVGIPTQVVLLPTVAAASTPAATATSEPAATAEPTAQPTVQATAASSSPLPTWTPIPTPVPGALSVDAGQDLGPISPLIFGSGYGPWVSLRPETLPLAEQAGVTAIRYPGGAWGDNNELQSYQIDQFVELARRMGAEPYIHVRFPNSTPEQAAEIVRYANVEKGYNVRYWSMGNEPSLYEGAGFPWTAKQYATEWRSFAAAMKAVDPNIVLIGPEIHQFTGTPNVDPKDSTGADWMRTFLQIAGDKVDIVSFHRYPFPATSERRSATIPELRADAATWDDIVRRLRDTIREETGRDLPVAVTEFNSHWSQAISGEATPDSFFSAIWLGDILGRLIEQKVDLANQFLLVSGGESGFGILAKYGPRPAYFTYQMYKMFGDQLVYASSDDSTVSVYAARRADGALTLMALNLGDAAVTKPLLLTGFTPSGDAQVWRFDADHQAEQIEDQPLADGAELTLPPQSMTLYVVE
jgi:hypothetical protein